MSKNASTQKTDPATENNDQGKSSKSDTGTTAEANGPTVEDIAKILKRHKISVRVLEKQKKGKPVPVERPADVDDILSFRADDSTHVLTVVTIDGQKHVFEGGK